MIIKLKIKIIAFFTAAAITFSIVASVIIQPDVLAVSDSINSFPIIMYHYITDDESKIGDYIISLKQLESDFKCLNDNGYQTLRMRDLYSINNGEMELPEKAVMLTFDDGDESFYKYVYPLLKKYNFSAVFSIIGKCSEIFSNINGHNIAYSHVTWDEINEMLQSGLVEIGNHSYDMHSNNGAGRSGATMMKGENIDQYTKSVTADIEAFNALAEKHLGFAPNFYTYPFGRFSKETAQIIKSNGFAAALTCYEIRNVPHSSEDWLYNLGRYHRSGKTTTEKFMKKIFF